MQVFAVSSLIAYILGVALAYQPFSSAVKSGYDDISGKLGFDPISAANSNIFHLLGISLLILISLRFYLHAKGINNPTFFELLNAKTNRRFEVILRGCWVLLALNLPSIIAVQKLFQTASKQTNQELAQLFMIFFNVLAIMYIAMVIWCRLYLDVVITMSSEKKKRINKQNQGSLTYPDFAICFVACVVALYINLVYWNGGNLDIIPFIAAIAFQILCLAIIVQLLYFFFGILIEQISGLLKKKGTIEVRH
jgi:hypothetical protein